MKSIVRCETLKRRLIIVDEANNAFIVVRKKKSWSDVRRDNIVAYNFEMKKRYVSIEMKFGGLIDIREAYALTLTYFGRHRAHQRSARTNKFGICYIRHRRIQLNYIAIEIQIVYSICFH